MNNCNIKTDLLTPRENEVMFFVTQGYSNQQIADKLCITKYTVKAHISSAIHKLGVKSRIKAALTYVQNNSQKEL